MGPELVIVIVGAVASVGAAWLTSRASTRSAEVGLRATIHQVQAEAYGRARETYEGALARLEAEVARQEGELSVLRRRVAALERQLRRAGLTPVMGDET
jgi:ATP-dependent protease ClpP protease subunit